MHQHHHTCIRLKRIVISLLSAFLIAAGTGTASAGSVTDLNGASIGAVPDQAMAILSGCVLLDIEECGMIDGGDVRMVLNAARTRLTVNVIDNEYEARLGRIPPKEVYEIDVHNRIVQTNDAPFMPTSASRKELGQTESLKASASPFPEGNWCVTGVKARNDKYGPYMIGTGAVGKVDVYLPGAREGEKTYVGTYTDTGYAIHSNTVPFEYSKSYGCLVARQGDVTKLANTLRRDKEENERAVQTIRVRGRREPPD